jgi:hypothetical protein
VERPRVPVASFGATRGRGIFFERPFAQPFAVRRAASRSASFLKTNFSVGGKTNRSDGKTVFLPKPFFFGFSSATVIQCYDGCSADR